jgi:hypothetical protein
LRETEGDFLGARDSKHTTEPLAAPRGKWINPDSQTAKRDAAAIHAADTTDRRNREQPALFPLKASIARQAPRGGTLQSRFATAGRLLPFNIGCVSGAK